MVTTAASARVISVVNRDEAVSGRSILCYIRQSGLGRSAEVRRFELPGACVMA
jgi:hypothetical protein